MTEPKDASNFSPAIRRGRITELKVYDVSELELEHLERGSSAGLFLNFSLALMATSISFWVALATTTIESIRLYCTFLVVACVTAIAGVVLFVLWMKDFRSVSRLIQTIRGRVISEGIPRPVLEKSSVTDRQEQ